MEFDPILKQFINIIMKECQRQSQRSSRYTVHSTAVKFVTAKPNNSDVQNILKMITKYGSNSHFSFASFGDFCQNLLFLSLATTVIG